MPPWCSWRRVRQTIKAFKREATWEPGKSIVLSPTPHGGIDLSATTHPLRQMGRFSTCLEARSSRMVSDTPPSYGESSSHVLTSAPTTEKRSPGAKRACVMLNRSDLLQAVGFPPDLTTKLDIVIRATWAKGVQKHKFEDGCWEWKLSGRPCEGLPDRHG